MTCVSSFNFHAKFYGAYWRAQVADPGKIKGNLADKFSHFPGKNQSIKYDMGAPTQAPRHSFWPDAQTPPRTAESADAKYKV